QRLVSDLRDECRRYRADPLDPHVIPRVRSFLVVGRGQDCVLLGAGRLSTDLCDERRWERADASHDRYRGEEDAALAAVEDARGRTRTCTGVSSLGLLRPMRIPISPPGRQRNDQLYALGVKSVYA